MLRELGSSNLLVGGGGGEWWWVLEKVQQVFNLINFGTKVVRQSQICELLTEHIQNVVT